MTNFSIYQINSERENARNFMYMGYEFIKKNDMELTLDMYDNVYDGKIETGDMCDLDALDEIYHIFNMSHPADFKGHSLSTSDIVLIDGKYYYCDSYGWVEVEFNQNTVEVPVETLKGGEQKFITIYEVKGKRIDDDEVRTLDRYLNKKEAEEYKKLCYELYSNCYRTFYIMEQMVWC